MEYFHVPVGNLFEEFSSSPHGISSAEAVLRIEKYGKNTIPQKQKNFLLLFLLQFKSPLIFILIGAAILSILVPYFQQGELSGKDWIDPIAIITILILNACFGFFQEVKAENTLAALKKMQAEDAIVIREGKEIKIPSEELVPGDVLLLAEGDKVSADARLLEAIELRVIESALTGESLPVEKNSEWKGKGGIAEQKNMLFSGTQIAAGRAKALVVSTGTSSEMGKIALLVAENESPKTPLEIRLDALGKRIGLLIVALCTLLFGVSLLRDVPVTEGLLTAIALAVSAIPEGLPAVMTISLAVGVAVMAKKNALVRELRAVETLGSVTVIASDKTGTITQNKMKVVTVYSGRKHYTEKELSLFANSETGKRMLDAGASCNDAKLPDIGDPTEIALLDIAHEYGIAKREKRISERPFSSEKKWMGTTHRIAGMEVEYYKGAPEVIATFCDPKRKSEIERAAEKMARDGLRTLAIAVRKERQPTAEFLGIFGIQDPPRKSAKEAIATAKEAGIRTIMITGDHAVTAAAIAAQVGLTGNVVTGEEIENKEEHELRRLVRITNIFARVSPEHKVRICAALQANGEIVTMTGDGVNDAPAIHRAEVGVAMGKNGTSVAREASDLVLMDDRYATIVQGIQEGRRIFSNIKKSISFLMRTNFNEVLVVSIGVIFGFPLPLLPIHILFVNLVTDSFPALALAAEEAEPNVMQQKPRPVSEGFLDGQWSFILSLGVAAAAFEFCVFFFTLDFLTLPAAQTLVLATMVATEFAIIFSVRHDTPIFSKGWRPAKNPWVLLSTLFGTGLFFVFYYTPLREFLHVTPFPIVYWIFPIVGAVFLFLLSEFLKYVKKNESISLLLRKPKKAVHSK